MPAGPWMREIERLRAIRVPRTFDTSITKIVGETQVRSRRALRALSGLGDAWEKVVPAELAACSSPERLVGGVLTVRTADASARFALDRWLRAGGEEAVRAAGKGGVRRIRLI